jgi:hypothetical protein
VDDNWVGLSDAISEVRRELAQAKLEGDGEPIRFELGVVELEFLLEARKDTSGDAGVKFGVSLSGRRGSSSASSHRVKVSLTPTTVGGGAVDIKDDD